MKKKLAEFLEVEETELKAIGIITIIAIAASPIIYNIVFAPMGWWL